MTEHECNIEENINITDEVTTAIEQSNLLLTTLIHHVPQQIFIVNRNTDEILLANDIATNELRKDPDYLKTIIHLISIHNEPDNGHEIGITYKHEGIERYLVVNNFTLNWEDDFADAYSINDVSETRKEIADLESHAYHDSLTKLYNRAYGMLTLDLWLHEKRRFVLIFIDLDSLKRVNDIFGHAEGDMYIVKASEYLKTLSPDAIVCRIGGDEYMLLVPDYEYDNAHKKMSEIAESFRNDEYQRDKDYSYNMSFGITAVDVDNILLAGDILETADSRMYENKKQNKAQRKQLRKSATNLVW
ncbi:MAG: GGDEF domain-containing protein [Oscillospiraceae bacterium]|nr:GGDEF domain-containing protein [Oscillospiraceae bacterium]